MRRVESRHMLVMSSPLRQRSEFALKSIMGGFFQTAGIRNATVEEVA